MDRAVAPGGEMGGESQPKYEVFISYSSKDKKWADATCAVLDRHLPARGRIPQSLLLGCPASRRSNQASPRSAGLVRPRPQTHGSVPEIEACRTWLEEGKMMNVREGCRRRALAFTTRQTHDMMPALCARVTHDHCSDPYCDGCGAKRSARLCPYRARRPRVRVPSLSPRFLNLRRAAWKRALRVERRLGD